MGVARRLYLYAVSSLSLLVLAAGLYNLLALALGQAADALGSSFLAGAGDDIGREQVSLAIALVLVGAPLFAIHWTFVARGWRGTDASGQEDRHSAIRAFHMAFVATIAMVFVALGASQVMERAFGTIFGLDDAFAPRVTDAIATIAIAVPIWWYHQRRRNLDIRHDRLSNAPAWITRLGRYGWAFIGLLLLTVGSSQILQTLASQVVDRQDFGSDGDIWLDQLAASLSLVVVGAIVFWLYAMDARRAIRDAATIGEDDRASALRAAYFGGVILACLGFVAVSVATAIAELGRFVMGVGDATGPGDLLELAVGPMLVAIPFAIAGWLHWGAQRREAAGLSPAALAGAERLGLHLTALAGITFLTVGAAQLLGRLFEVITGGVRIDEFVRYELAWFVAQVIVGAALWLPAWMAILRRRAADPSVERRAAASRAYLYLVVGVAIIATVPSAAFVLFRLIDRVLGGSGSALSGELAIPIAVLIVASIVAAYHGRLVVADLRYTKVAAAEELAPVVAVAADADAGSVVDASDGAELVVTLRAADGTDLEALLDRLRTDLPPGVTLERGGG